jgi:hypothetical protein
MHLVSDVLLYLVQVSVYQNFSKWSQCSTDHKNYIKPKLKDLKNIILQNSSSNLFNRECTRMVLGVTQRFLRLRKKISDFDVKIFRKNRQRNYLVTPNLQSSTITTCSLKSRFLKIDFECWQIVIFFRSQC